MGCIPNAARYLDLMHELLKKKERQLRKLPPF